MVVEDIPLLVETGLAPMFPLVVVVHADEDTRVERLIKRGMDEADARARIAAQASEEQRRAIADVLLDNSGSQGEFVEKARDLWYQRVLPLAHNIRTRQTVRSRRSWCPTTRLGPMMRDGSSTGSQRRAGTKALRIDHIGSTAVAGHGRQGCHRHSGHRRVAGLADETRRGARRGRLPARSTDITSRRPHTGRRPVRCGSKRFHGAADPGRPANVHIRVDGWPDQQFALLFIDWLKANPGVREDYLAAKRTALAARRTTPRRRSPGSSTPIGAPGLGQTPPAGGPAAGSRDGAVTVPAAADRDVGGRFDRRRYGSAAACVERSAALQRAVERVVLDAEQPRRDELIGLRDDLVVDEDLAVQIRPDTASRWTPSCPPVSGRPAPC